MGNDCGTMCEAAQEQFRQSLKAKLAKSHIPDQVSHSNTEHNLIDLDGNENLDRQKDMDEYEYRDRDGRVGKNSGRLAYFHAQGSGIGGNSNQHHSYDEEYGNQQGKSSRSQKLIIDLASSKKLNASSRSKNHKQQQINGCENQLDNDDDKALKLQKRKQHQFSSGAKYDGEWVGNRREGQGVQTWPDGARYEGAWKNNKAQGKGTFTHVNGDSYQGEWKEDKADGFGVYTHVKKKGKVLEIQATYKGYWKNDMMDGSGVEIYADGTKYDGMFKQGKRKGTGTYFFAEGQIFKGDWSNGKIEGFGICKWPDGKVYQGQWLDSKKHGKGEYKWPDGRKYKGDYKQNKRHGTGTYTWADGRSYQGQWKNDMRHGKGKYYINQRQFREGQWLEGERVKWL